MTLNKIIQASIAGTILLTYSSCGGPKAVVQEASCAAAMSCSSATGPTPIPTSATSTIPVYVADPSTTGKYGYFNEPLVSVTVCTPNHTLGTQCQTISNVLLDTGSFGLRVFSSAISNSTILASLTPVTITESSQTLNLAECAQFGSGADWGSVNYADVVLGGQTATNIPIQLIDISYGSIPSSCAALCPDTDPCTAGYNGILGVGMFAQDCGNSYGNQCGSTTPVLPPYVPQYFGCTSATGGTCSSQTSGGAEYTVTVAKQVVNPIAAFGATYNNGGSLTLPNISSSGAAAITTGTFTIGIPTTQTASNVYPADPGGMQDYGLDFNTVYAGNTYGYGSSDPRYNTAFIDSGSNTISFDGNLTQCSDSPGFYCPSSTQNLTAYMQGYQGTPSVAVNFSIANLDYLSVNFSTPPGLYSAFNDIGTVGTMGEYTIFDWGLPFFFNRTVYVGLLGTTGQGTTGPFWAF